MTTTPNPPPDPRSYHPWPDEDTMAQARRRYQDDYHAWLNLLDDGDFWEWTLNRRYPGEDTPDGYGDDYEPDEPSASHSPCPTCGTTDSACGYDPEGRPYVHATPADIDEDGDRVPGWYRDFIEGEARDSCP